MGAPGQSSQVRGEPWAPGHCPTVAAAIDGALVEDHDVLGECARLVREDVLHLAQLLIQRGGAGLRGRPFLHAEHLLVPVDEVAVAQADDLNTAQGTGSKARAAGGRGAHPTALAAGPPPGENGKEQTPWVQEPGGKGKGSRQVVPASCSQQGAPTLTPTL